MKALITGVAGFIGSTLAERLVRSGVSVVGIDSFSDYYSTVQKRQNIQWLCTNPPEKFRLIEQRLQDVALPELLSDCTHVFHLAGQAGVRKSWGRDFDIYTADNIQATQMLLEACVAAPIERLVYASSSSVYGDVLRPKNPSPKGQWAHYNPSAETSRLREDGPTQPVSPYGVSKLAAEHLCYLYHANHGVPTVSLRFFTVYGPRQRPDMAFHKFLLAAHTGQPITLFGDGQQTRDFTYIDDIVTAVVSAATRGTPGSVYNLGGGVCVTVRHVLELIERVTGRQLRLNDVGSQKGDMRHTHADTTRAQRDLGFAPTMDLERGLAAEYAWLITSQTEARAVETRIFETFMRELYDVTPNGI